MVLGAILLLVFWALIFSTIFSCNSKEVKETVPTQDTFFVFKAEPNLSQEIPTASFEPLMNAFRDRARLNEMQYDWHEQEQFAQGVERYLNGTIDSAELQRRTLYLSKKEKELWKTIFIKIKGSEKKEKIVKILNN